MTSQPRRHASMQVERSSVMEISLIVISPTDSKDSDTKRPTFASSCRLLFISAVALEVVEDVILWAEAEVVADKSLVGGEMSIDENNKRLLTNIHLINIIKTIGKAVLLVCLI